MHFDQMNETGLLGPLEDLLDNCDDVLVRLNAVELLTDVAFTHQGLRSVGEKINLFRPLYA